MTEAITCNNEAIISLFSNNDSLIQELIDAIRKDVDVELRIRRISNNDYKAPFLFHPSAVDVRNALNFRRDDNNCSNNSNFNNTSNVTGSNDDEDDNDLKLLNASSAKQVLIDIVINDGMWIKRRSLKKENIAVDNVEENQEKRKTMESYECCDNLCLVSSSLSSSSLVPSLMNLLHLIVACKHVNISISVPFINMLLELGILRVVTKLISLNLWPYSKSDIEKRSSSLEPFYHKRIRKLLIEIVDVLVQVCPSGISSFILKEDDCFMFFEFSLWINFPLLELSIFSWVTISTSK
jgi:hypothetical protein